MNCFVCNNRFFSSQEAFKQHWKTSSAHPFCSYCNRRFISDRAYEQHLETVTHVLVCESCPNKPQFPGYDGLKHHLLTTASHPVCLRCDKGFLDEEAFDRHVKFYHAPIRCSPCNGRTVIAEDVEEHYLASPNHPKCTSCNRGFADDSSFDEVGFSTRLGCGCGPALIPPQHTSTSHPDLRCEPCGRQYGSAELLERHYRSSASHRSCVECDIGFRDDEAYLKHTLSPPHVPSPKEAGLSGLPDSQEQVPSATRGSLPYLTVPLQPFSPSTTSASLHSARSSLSISAEVFVSQAAVPELPAPFVPGHARQPSKPKPVSPLLPSLDSIWFNGDGLPDDEVYNPTPATAAPRASPPLSAASVLCSPFSPAVARPVVTSRATRSGSGSALSSSSTAVSPSDSGCSPIGAVGIGNDGGADFCNAPSAHRNGLPSLPNPKVGVPHPAWSMPTPGGPTYDLPDYHVPPRMRQAPAPAPVPTLVPVFGPVTPGAHPARGSGPSLVHCRICRRDPCDSATATTCGHVFCKGCIEAHVMATSKCPVCAQAVLLYCLFRLDLSA